MGLIGDIIRDGNIVDPGERNKAAISALLNDQQLKAIKDESVPKKMLVPNAFRTDDFKSGVLAQARECQALWTGYLKAQARKETADKSDKMIAEFTKLDEKADLWLREHADAADDHVKVQNCHEFKQLAKIAIREIKRDALDRNPMNKQAAEQVILKYCMNGKDFAPDLVGPDDWQKMADETGLSLQFVKAALENLRDSAAEILPADFNPGTGWTKKGSFANPNLPAQTRPMLSLEEAKGVNVYSAEGFKLKNGEWLLDGDGPARPFQLIQRHLKTGADIDPELMQQVDAMRSAFRKCQPINPPVEIVRNLTLRTEDDVRNFRAKYTKGARIVELGFASGAAKGGGAAKGFAANATLRIQATRGLDFSPYTNSTEEMELLMDHESVIEVTRVSEEQVGTDDGGTRPVIVIHCRQV